MIIVEQGESTNLKKVLHYCKNCGIEWSSVPFHSCSDLDIRPMGPFCVECGGTLRTGFVKHVTCQGHEENTKIKEVKRLEMLKPKEMKRLEFLVDHLNDEAASLHIIGTSILTFRLITNKNTVYIYPEFAED